MMAHTLPWGEIDHAIALGVSHAVAKDRTAHRLRIRLGQQVGQAVAEKDVVAQNHGRGRTGEEILCKKIGLRQPIGAGLFDILQGQAPVAAIAKRAAELVLILRGRDHRDLTDTGQHQDAERVIDHRLVVDRQKLLRQAHGDGVKPGAGPARQDDAFARRHRLNPYKPLRNRSFKFCFATIRSNCSTSAAL